MPPEGIALPPLGGPHDGNPRHAGSLSGVSLLRGERDGNAG